MAGWGAWWNRIHPGNIRNRWSSHRPATAGSFPPLCKSAGMNWIGSGARLAARTRCSQIHSYWIRRCTRWGSRNSERTARIARKLSKPVHPSSSRDSRRGRRRNPPRQTCRARRRSHLLSGCKHHFDREHQPGIPSSPRCKCCSTSPMNNLSHNIAGQRRYCQQSRLDCLRNRFDRSLGFVGLGAHKDRIRTRRSSDRQLDRLHCTQLRKRQLRRFRPPGTYPHNR